MRSPSLPLSLSHSLFFISSALQLQQHGPLLESSFSRPAQMHSFPSVLRIAKSSRFFGIGVCWIIAKIAGAEPPSESSMCVDLRGSYTGSSGVSQQIARSIRVFGSLQPSTGSKKQSCVLFFTFARSSRVFIRSQLADQVRKSLLKTESSTRSGSGWCCRFSACNLFAKANLS